MSIWKNNRVSNLKPTREAHVSTHHLWHDVLTRRPKLDPRKQPGKLGIDDDSYYSSSIVSIDRLGRTMEVVLTFQLPTTGSEDTASGAVALFCSIDLHSGAYKERDWMKSNADVSDDLSEWSQKLALDRRMRLCRVGPYTANETKWSSNVWGSLCNEHMYLDPDEEANFDSALWEPFLQKPAILNAPKRIAVAALYLDSDVITSDPVRNAIPVLKLQCKDAPIELVYE